MSLARYKDLCIDAVDPESMARFWAAVLRLDADLRGSDPSRLSGPTPQHTLWVNPVPEPKSVKHRVHLDVNVESVDQIAALGATVLDGESFPWTVMADPEGGEFCVFVRDGGISRRLYEIVVDCSSPVDLATWWADLLGGRSRVDESGAAYVEEIPGAPFEFLVFDVVPEPKSVKNRVHLDVTTRDVAPIVTAGASVVRLQDDEIGWHVLADPEGNEFCAFVVSDR